MFYNLLVESFFYEKSVINQRINKKILTSDFCNTPTPHLSKDIGSGLMQNMLNII